MKQSLKRTVLLLVLSSLLGLSIAGHAVAASSSSSKKTITKSTTQAQSPPTDESNGILHSYNASSAVQTGMVVELKPNDPTTVIPLPQNQIKNMFGVVIPNANAAVVLTSPTAQQQQVLVSKSGELNVLVSNQNGKIQSGDPVTVSSLDGITMKADDGESLLVGRADGSFDGTTNVIGNMQLKDSTKQTVNVAIGVVPVEINVTRNPSYQQKTDYVPSFLVKIATTVVAKPVSAARLYLSLVILIGTIIIVANVLYSGVRGGMVAVGRNPLSKKSIIKSLIQTVMAGLIIFIVGIFAVYLLLKL